METRQFVPTSPLVGSITYAYDVIRQISHSDETMAYLGGLLSRLEGGTVGEDYGKRRQGQARMEGNSLAAYRAIGRALFAAPSMPDTAIGLSACLGNRERYKRLHTVGFSRVNCLRRNHACNSTRSIVLLCPVTTVCIS